MLFRIVLICCLLLRLVAADGDREAIITHCVEKAGPDQKSVTLVLFGKVHSGFIMIKADRSTCHLHSPQQSLSIAWRALSDEQVCTLAEPTIMAGSLAAKRAFMVLLGANARKHSLYQALSQQLSQQLPEQQGEQLSGGDPISSDKPVKAGGPTASDTTSTAVADDAPPITVASGGDPAVDDQPESVRDWDMGLFTKKKTINASAYFNAVAQIDAKYVDKRLGPSGKFLGTDTRQDPLIFARSGETPYLWKKRVNTPVDWTGYGGQVGYIPQEKSDPGLGRIRFAWSNHENHGGPQFWHEYFLAPTYKEWWAKEIDPGLTRPEWTQMSEGTLPRPLVLARSTVSWSNCAVMAFSNGLLGASGYGNNDDKYPCTRLPNGCIPSAIAITPNNEFALVTTWHARKQIGELHVVALESRGMPHHNPPYAGLPNVACYSRLKVLGSIELPFSCPSGIATTSDVAQWKWSSPLAKEQLSDAAVRTAWVTGKDPMHRYPKSGFAVVISRAESKACLVDLSPLYAAFAKSYFTEWDKAVVADEGPGAQQWPPTFEHLSDATPRVGKAFRIPQPTVVACGYAEPASMANKVFIGCMNGQLHIMEPVSGQLKPIASLAVGRNPLSISLGRNLNSHRKDTLLVLSRGDRQICVVNRAGNTDAHIEKILRDKRLIDPVSLQAWESRGASGFTVADYAGHQLVNYLYEQIRPWGDTSMYPDFGGSDKDPFECSGILPMKGYPYLLSAAEVN